MHLSSGVLDRRIFALVTALSLQLAACTSFAPVIEEPLRVGAVADMSPERLGLRVGVTTLAQAREVLVARGHTGVAEDVHAMPRGRAVGVLVADYQSRVHVFVDDRYHHSVALPTRGVPPYGVAVKAGDDGQSPTLLVLVRDPLSRVDVPPRLFSFAWRADTFAFIESASLESLAARHGGMTRPMLLGSTLYDGVLLVARDKDGVLWDTTYFLRRGEGHVSLEPQPIGEALRCSCVRKYAFGVTSH